VLRDDGRGVEDLLFHAVVVPNTSVAWDLCLAGFEVNAHGNVVHTRFLLKEWFYGRKKRLVLTCRVTITSMAS
jgi:hypothetical protein